MKQQKATTWSTIATVPQALKETNLTNSYKQWRQLTLTYQSLQHARRDLPSSLFLVRHIHCRNRSFFWVLFVFFGPEVRFLAVFFFQGWLVPWLFSFFSTTNTKVCCIKQEHKWPQRKPPKRQTTSTACADGAWNFFLVRNKSCAPHYDGGRESRIILPVAKL